MITLQWRNLTERFRASWRDNGLPGEPPNAYFAAEFGGREYSLVRIAGFGWTAAYRDIRNTILMGGPEVTSTAKPIGEAPPGHKGVWRGATYQTRREAADACLADVTRRTAN